VNVTPPVDLNKRTRQVLEIYRRGQKPLYSDAYPATKTNGQTDLMLGPIAKLSGRREPLWSYLRRRQLFAINRTNYEDGQR
jgi:hypothetical protein